MITTIITIIMQVKSKFVPVYKHHTKAYKKSGVKVPCTLIVRDLAMQPMREVAG